MKLNALLGIISSLTSCVSGLSHFPCIVVIEHFFDGCPYEYSITEL